VTVGGDRLGAGGFYRIDLQQDARYRFRVINQQGDTRVLGEYTAKSAGVVNLEIGSVSYSLGEGTDTWQWNADLENVSGAGYQATFAYTDYQNLTENVTVELKTRENGTVLASQTFTNGPYGEVVFTHSLNESVVENNTLVVEWSAGRDGEVLTGKRLLGGSRLLNLPLDEIWQTVGFGALTLLLAFLVGAGVGVAPALVTIAASSAFGVYIGVAPPELGFGATLLVMLLGGIYMVRTPDGPQ